MSELGEKVKQSIARLRLFEPDDGYYLAFSGGKDSVVCKALLDEAGVKYDSTYRVTSVDPPELVQFIKDKHPDVVREIPHDKDGKPISMWSLIVREHIPPTRVNRYCCRYLKEDGGKGRVTVTGVRWAESVNRKKSAGIVSIMGKGGPRQREGWAKHGFTLNDKENGLVLLNDDNDTSREVVEQCYKKKKTNINPIVDWNDEDVWGYIHTNGIPYCSLYDEGFLRLGCIGCPMCGIKRRLRDFERWPKYKENYIRTFERMLIDRERLERPFQVAGRERERERERVLQTSQEQSSTGGLKTLTTSEEVFDWWVHSFV